MHGQTKCIKVCFPMKDISLSKVIDIFTELLHSKNKGINLHAGVFTNLSTVLLQFYAQFHSNSIQIYHRKTI